jgi:murein L,D-transpeptidase YcbB/YkuD
MKKTTLILIATFLLSLAVSAQTNNTPAAQETSAQTSPKKKPPIFRANKEQITQAQKILKIAESGKLDADTRAALKTFQGANGLKSTGTLNRATLEKMNVALTAKQKEIPVSASSFASANDKTKSSASKRGPVFRATKDQIMQAQKMMKERAIYTGSETGKLDDATREGLKKFQSANGVKATGTLNRETLEKMGIALNDKQKEIN